MTPLPKFSEAVLLPTPLIGFLAYTIAKYGGSQAPQYAAASLALVYFILAHAAWMLFHSQHIETTDLRTAVRGMWTRNEYTTPLAEPAEAPPPVPFSNPTATRTIPLCLVLKDGPTTTRRFIFPPGVDRPCILALANLIAAGQPPTNDNLCPPFTKGADQNLAQTRDYFMQPEKNKMGTMAQYTNAKGEWEFTKKGERIILQLALQLVNPDYPPLPHLLAALKTRLSQERSDA